MPRLRDITLAGLVAAVVVASAGCAPRPALARASGPVPARCEGSRLLDVQNNSDLSVAILETTRGAAVPAQPIALLGRGWHTLEVNPEAGVWYRAEIAWKTPFEAQNHPILTSGSSFHLVVRCVRTG